MRDEITRDHCLHSERHIDNMTIHRDDQVARARLLYRENHEWYLAIRLQCDRLNKERLLANDLSYNSDVRLYFMAWNVFDLVGKEIEIFTKDTTLATLRNQLKDNRGKYKDVRDVLSHINEYIKGTGNLQTDRKGKPAKLSGMPTFHRPIESSYASSSNTVVMNLGQSSHTEIDIDKATEEAQQIYKAVTATLLQQFPDLMTVNM